jgi:hypothetical protein
MLKFRLFFPVSLAFIPFNFIYARHAAPCAHYRTRQPYAKRQQAIHTSTGKQDSSGEQDDCKDGQGFALHGG